MVAKTLPLIDGWFSLIFSKSSLRKFELWVLGSSSFKLRFCLLLSWLLSSWLLSFLISVRDSISSICFLLFVFILLLSVGGVHIVSYEYEWAVLCGGDRLQGPFWRQGYPWKNYDFKNWWLKLLIFRKIGGFLFEKIFLVSVNWLQHFQFRRYPYWF